MFLLSYVWGYFQVPAVSFRECKVRDVRVTQPHGFLLITAPRVSRWRFKEVNGGAQAEWEEIFPNTLEARRCRRYMPKGSMECCGPLG